MNANYDAKKQSEQIDAFFMNEDERKAQPRAGDVFRIKTDITGLVEPQFAG